MPDNGLQLIACHVGHTQQRNWLKSELLTLTMLEAGGWHLKTRLMQPGMSPVLLFHLPFWKSL